MQLARVGVYGYGSGQVVQEVKTLAMQAFSAPSYSADDPVTDTSQQYKNTPNRQIVFAGLGVL